MGVRALPPALLGYLGRLQSETIVGVHELAQRDAGGSVRSVYRWRRRLGDRLLVVPSVAVEYLGLLHAHVVVVEPDEGWFSCPYAVEASWVGQDAVQGVLYVHCLVPVLHQRHAAALFASLPAERVEVVWSGSGWQQVLSTDDPIALPVASVVRDVDDDLLRKYPLVIPAVMESWRYPNSMPAVWARIKLRVPALLRWYVRGRLHLVNGKGHVRDAFAALASAGLVRQHVVRYQPLLPESVEAFFVACVRRDDLRSLLTSLRSLLYAVESYPTSDGYFCRVVGRAALVERLLMAPGVRVLCLNTRRSRSPNVRFCYDDLFDPRNGTWRTPGVPSL